MKLFWQKLLKVLPILLIACSPCYGETIQTPPDEMHKTSQDVSRQQLLALCAGEWVSRGVYVATKLEIADHLESGPKSIEELAKLSHSNVDSLRRLLQMLTSFDVFEETSINVFANTNISRLLAKSSSDSLHSISLFYGEDIHKCWSEILSSVQTGMPAFDLAYSQPVFPFLKNNPERAALFQTAMSEKSKAVIASVISNYNFGQFNSVCDVGGGYGQFIQALLQKYDSLIGTVFELPEVIEKLKAQNPDFECNRFQLIAGDFFSTIPTGQDAYILKSVIHDWDDAKSELILSNCYKAMRSDSRLLIVEVVLQAGDKQSYANCMDFLMLAVTGGKERTLLEMSQLLENSGFVIEKIHPTSTEFSVIEAKRK